MKFLMALEYWQILAGVGLFLFGMNLMENAISHLAGRSFKIFLRDQTTNPFKAVFAGLIITAALQSSSIVNLLILAFVGAGIISMRNAMAVVLGSNLGSTVYNWMVVYLGFKIDIQAFAFPMMALGAVGLIFFQNKKKSMNRTRLLFGLSLLFIGLSYIKTGVEQLVHTIDFSAYTDNSRIVFVLIGFVVTAIVQSSSATMVITLSALSSGILSFEMAACVVIGTELGTTIKIIIGSIGTVPDKKRVALGNFLFNLTGVIIAFILLDQFIYLIKDVVGFNDPLVGLVCLQSIINLTVIVVYFPFLKPFSDFLQKQFSEGPDRLTKYINNLVIPATEEALQSASKESHRLINNIVILNMEGYEINHEIYKEWHINQDKIPLSGDQSYSERYELIKQLDGEILDFCIALRKPELTESENKRINNMISILTRSMNSAKSVKNIRHNIKNYRDSANDLLHNFFQRIRNEEGPFYQLIVEQMRFDSDAQFKAISELMHQNKKKKEKWLSEVFQLTTSGKIDDLEMATLINVFDAIYDSHEALLVAINELNTFDKNGSAKINL